jgi:hypothetical protein
MFTPDYTVYFLDVGGEPEVPRNASIPGTVKGQTQAILTLF